jgi:hypothetical protein
MKSIVSILLALTLTNCTENSANHVGNPLLLPMRGVSSAIGNGIYNKRRAQVKTYVQSHHADILMEITSLGGPHLEHAYDLARVIKANRPTLTQQLLDDRHIYFVKDTEPLVVALMVHGS